MLTINATVAIVAICMALLVGRAYLPNIPLFGRPTPAMWLARSFTVATVFYLPRIAYWDVWWWFIGGAMSMPILNTIVNLGVIISAYCALKARHLAIPDAERGRFNWLTAAWYPKSLPMIR